MPLPPGFVLEAPQANLTPAVRPPPGFVLEGQIQGLNPTEPSLEAQPLTMGRRLRAMPVVGEAINRLLGPEVAHTQAGGQQEGMLNQIAQGLMGPLQASPAMVMRQPQSYPEAVTKGIVEQVNPQNILLGGTLGALHKAQGAGPLVDWLKATIAAYFAKQGAEMGGQALGERTAGAPVAPERKGELDVQTLMGTLMALGPMLGMKGEKPKQTDVGPTSANLTIQDAEDIEGRAPLNRRLTQFNPTQAANPPVNELGQRPGQVPIKALERYPQAGEGRVAGAGPIVEKRPSQEAPRVIGEPMIGQRLIQPKVPEGFVLEQASQPQGEPKQGGQISFASPAEAGAIPSARQTAIQDVRPAVRTMDGKVLVGQKGQVHNEIIEQNNLLPTNIDRRMFVDAQGNEISREQLAQMGVPDVGRAVPGAHAPELAKVQEGGRPSGGGLKLKPTEEQLRKKSQEGAINLAGPAEVLKDFKAKVMDGTQIVNRLRNKLHPDEWKMYEDLGIVGAFAGKKVDPKDVAKWMEDNGPKVEVRKFGEGSQTPEQKEYAQLSHSFFDSLSPVEQSAIRNVNRAYGEGSDFEGAWKVFVEDKGLTRIDKEKAKRFAETRQRTVEQGGSQSAHWSSIAPKLEQDMPGYTEGAVVARGGKLSAEHKDIARRLGADPEAEPLPQFPSSHSFPPNTLAFWRGYMETTPEGKKVFHVIEVQSDWAQARREAEESAKKHYPEATTEEERRTQMGTRYYPQTHPLLRQYERLALKSAIEHAKAEGADAIAVSDAETAMMTEGHDLNRNRVMTYPATPENVELAKKVLSDKLFWENNVSADEAGMIRMLAKGEDGVSNRNKISNTLHQKINTKFGGFFEERYREDPIAQEPGMRLHYDRTLPGILEELTGQKGERVAFGEHRMAVENPSYEESFTDQRVTRPRKDLIFREPTGEPKTSVTAKVFPLDKTGTNFTMFGKDRPKASEATTFKAPTGGGLKLKPTEEQLRQKSQEGAVSLEPIKELGERFTATLKVLGDAAKRQGVKGDITALNRAVDNLSFRAQTQAENHMKLEASKQFGGKSQTALNAMFAMLEGAKTGGLAKALTKSAKNKDMQEAIRFAQDPANQPGLRSMVDELKKLDAQNQAFAKANGVSIPTIEDYLKHAYATEPRPFFFFEKPSPGVGMGSKQARKFPTIFDAIEAGHKPLTLDAAALVGKRTQEIFQEVQTKKWLDGFRKVSDPASGEPIVADLGKMGLPPEGYVKVSGLNVAIKEGYKSIFTALTGESHISNNMVGQLLLETEGAVKHGTLAFDVFHAARVAQFAKSVSISVGYKKGLSLLEYSSRDLQEAVNQGLAPEEAVKYQNEKTTLSQGTFTNRELGSIAIQEGANIARHSEAIYSSFVRTFPGLKQTVGRFNRWVFDKMSRGALYEANVAEIKRVAQARPDLTIRQVARMVSRDLNYRFGSIQKQGLIKGKTVQDISQLLFLAPKWFESLGQSEARSAGQVVRSLTPGQHLGSLGFSSAKLLTAYILGTQAINIAFNGHTTFQNKNNKGHEIDAFIPPFTKDGKGFYVSPLSVVGELEHDMLRYTRQSDKPGTVDKVVDAGTRIVENKLSPPVHGVLELASGKDYKGEKVEGWNRILDAFVTGVNPSPLPARQTVASLKEKDVAPAERQAFSMLGIKAEPESFSDVRQRKIEELGKAPLSERAKLEKDLKAMRPTSSDSAKLAAGQRAMEAQLNRKNALREKLSDDIQGWLKSKKLDIQGFVPELTKNKQRITLTEREREWFMNELTTQYTRFLKPWVGQDVTQERLNSRLLQARNVARRNLFNAIESDSINESDKEKSKKKRFSFMGGD